MGNGEWGFGERGKRGKLEISKRGENLEDQEIVH